MAASPGQAEAVASIQHRCKSVSEQLQVLAGSPHDLIASANPSADLFREAASLLLGYDQCLLVESVLTRKVVPIEIRQERDELLSVLHRRGYHRCDVPACNCNGWHGGHAEARLSEIHDALTEAGLDMNGKTIRMGVSKVLLQRDELLAALKEMTDDIEARWDMRDRSTNPGIRHCVEQARAAIAEAKGK